MADEKENTPVPANTAHGAIGQFTGAGGKAAGWGVSEAQDKENKDRSAAAAIAKGMEKGTTGNAATAEGQVNAAKAAARKVQGFDEWLQSTYKLSSASLTPAQRFKYTNEYNNRPNK
jgi:hypothetical protein